jgi:tetratricopeptide (TPR) repeat protein
LVSSKNNSATTKKQLIQDALTASLEGRWDDAISLNDQIVERSPRDSEALNRKGRALIEKGDLIAAREVYAESLKADPANMIARRNLQRLELLYGRDAEGEQVETQSSAGIPHSSVFVEEVGKTWVDELVNPQPAGKLAEVAPGSQLTLEVKDERLFVTNEHGEELGEVEARIAGRIMDLMNGGNRFEVYALGMSGHSLRVILREVSRDDSQADKIAFPRQVRAMQGLMREREALFARDEADFDFGDEDAEDEEHAAERDDEEEELETEADREAESYVDTSVNDDEEEPEM